MNERRRDGKQEERRSKMKKGDGSDCGTDEDGKTGPPARLSGGPVLLLWPACLSGLASAVRVREFEGSASAHAAGSGSAGIVFPSPLIPHRLFVSPR